MEDFGSLLANILSENSPLYFFYKYVCILGRPEKKACTALSLVRHDLPLIQILAFGAANELSQDPKP